MLNLKSAPIDPKVVRLLNEVRAWALNRSDISAFALVGSHAHGRARTDSDIDLVILSDDPDPLRASEWLTDFGVLSGIQTEHWGALTSHRVQYLRDGEVEVGVASTSWARVPIDPGTFRVASDGLIPVYDPRGVLDRLLREVRRVQTR